MPSETDKEWFSNEVKDMQSVLYNVAYSIVGRADAEDVVCDAVVKGWQAFDKLPNRTYFRPWLMKILKFTAYDALKKRKNDISYDDAIGTYREPGTDDSEQEQEKERLWQALYKLNDDMRLALVLFYMESFSIKEIAKICSTTEGTVKSRLKRGRDKLKIILERSGYNA